MLQTIISKAIRYFTIVQELNFENILLCIKDLTQHRINPNPSHHMMKSTIIASAFVLAATSSTTSAFTPSPHSPSINAFHSRAPSSKVENNPQNGKVVAFPPLNMSSETEAKSNNNNPINNFLGNLFKRENEVEVVEPEKPKIPDFVVSSDYTLSYLFAAIGLFVIFTSPGT